MTSRSRMKRKEADDVLGGEETWRDADSTASLSLLFLHDAGSRNVDPRPIVTCDKCNHPRAYFYQLQIRSADEPMTTCMCFLSTEFGVLGADSWLRVTSLQVSFSDIYDNQCDNRVPDALDVPTNGAKINLIIF